MRIQLVFQHGVHVNRGCCLLFFVTASKYSSCNLFWLGSKTNHDGKQVAEHPNRGTPMLAEHPRPIVEIDPRLAMICTGKKRLRNSSRLRRGSFCIVPLCPFASHCQSEPCCVLNNFSIFNTVQTFVSESSLSKPIMNL